MGPDPALNYFFFIARTTPFSERRNLKNNEKENIKELSNITNIKKTKFKLKIANQKCVFYK